MNSRMKQVLSKCAPARKLAGVLFIFQVEATGAS